MCPLSSQIEWETMHLTSEAVQDLRCLKPMNARFTHTHTLSLQLIYLGSLISYCAFNNTIPHPSTRVQQLLDADQPSLMHLLTSRYRSPQSGNLDEIGRAVISVVEKRALLWYRISPKFYICYTHRSVYGHRLTIVGGLPEAATHALSLDRLFRNG